MSVSLLIVSIIIVLIMLGAGQRILDGLRLNDKEAIIILILIAVGIVIPPVWIGQYFCFSIGGFLIPFALSIYLLFSCGWSRDLVRSLIGTIIVGGVIYGLQWILPADPENVVIDNMYLYGLVAGIVAYALGRSRRNAFISCLFGIALADIFQGVINFYNGVPSIIGLGVGGAFSTYVVAIIIAVALSEFIGRIMESIHKDAHNKKEFNFDSHIFDSEKNGRYSQTQKDKRIDNIRKNKTQNSAKSNKKQAKKVQI